MNAAEALARHFWAAMGTHLWQSTLVLAVIFVLDRMLRSAPARFPHRLWWAALAKLVLPLALLGPIGQLVAGAILRIGGPGQAAAPAPFVTTLTVLLDPFRRAEGPGPESSTAGGFLWSALTLFWAVGAVWVLRRGLEELGSAHAARAGTLASAPPAVRSRIEAALAGTGIPAAGIRITAGHRMPAVAGLIRPVIVLPERACLELDPAELRSILRHEDGHRRRHDPLLGLLQRIVLAFYFYYPPVWIVLRRVRAAAELTCDERAARGESARQTFAGALARLLSLQLEPGPVHAAAGRSRASLLEERFIRIREPWRYKTMRTHRIILGAGITLIALASFGPLVPTRRAAAAPARRPILVTGDVIPPKLIHKVQPEYPKDARKARIDGRVILEAIINTSGDVEDLKVLRSIPSLDEAAIAAVQQWKYEPATLHGRPVKVYFTVMINFTLDHPEPAPELVQLTKGLQPLTLELEDVPLSKLLDLLGHATGLTIERGHDLPADLRVTVSWKEEPAREALERLAKDFGLRYEVKDETRSIVVHKKAEEEQAGQRL